MSSLRSFRWVLCLAALISVIVSVMLIVPRVSADNCGTHHPHQPGPEPWLIPKGACLEPWQTCACIVKDAPSGVVCDDNSICWHEVVSNQKVDWYYITDDGEFAHAQKSGSRSRCLVLLYECNPFGSPPCEWNLDTFDEQVWGVWLHTPCPQSSGSAR
jgi:hypothetical protein